MARSQFLHEDFGEARQTSLIMVTDPDSLGRSESDLDSVLTGYASILGRRTVSGARVTRLPNTA